MSIIGFQGRYREERLPFYEKKSQNKAEINRFFKCMQSPNIQSKISKLPHNTLVNVSIGEDKGSETVNLMYVPYGEGEHERFEKLSGKTGLDTLTLTTKSYNISDLKQNSLSKKVSAFLDDILSVYDSSKK